MFPLNQDKGEGGPKAMKSLVDMKKLLVVAMCGMWVCLWGEPGYGGNAATEVSVRAGSVVSPQHEVESVAARPVGPSVAEYVRSGGRVDLEAVRASGYEGALDLEGYEVRVDPKTGEPVVMARTPESAATNPDDIYWADGFCLPGMNARVFALAVYDSKLVFGGDFTAAGCVPAKGIASWDGANWAAFGSGVEGGYQRVIALTVYDGELIAGVSVSTESEGSRPGFGSWKLRFRGLRPSGTVEMTPSRSLL
jgi:hypothetical protein